jgi:hypothetical protein
MKKKWVFWIISLLLTIVCVFINQQYFPMKEMIKLEFASSPEDMSNHIMAIGLPPVSCYHILLMNTIVDYGFLVSYSLLTFFSFKLFLDVFQLSVKPWVYFLSFMTGLLDAIENYFLIKTALAQEEIFSPVFFWAVRIKWAAALIPLLLIPIVMLYALLLLFRARK